MSKTSISFAGLKADRPGLGDIYEDKLEYEKESGDRPWLEGFYRRLEAWAQIHQRAGYHGSVMRASACDRVCRSGDGDSPGWRGHEHGGSRW